MITVKCDNCEKVLQAPDDQAGMKLKCPHCGDMNTLPPKSPGRVDRAAAKGLPPDSGPEQTVLRVRPEMFRARPLLFMGHLVVLAAGVVGGFYFGTSQHNSTMVGVSIVAAVIALGSLGVWKVRKLGSSLEITNKRSIERVGILSRFTSEILHEDVRNVQISQTFPERLMGIGTIGISSAGQDGLEISVKDIRKPDRIRELIDQYRPM